MPQTRRASIVCAMLCLTSCCGVLQAQELSEREFLSEFPMVLSASRLRQNVMDAPQSVTLIDQDTIRASGVRGRREICDGAAVRKAYLTCDCGIPSE